MHAIVDKKHPTLYTAPTHHSIAPIIVERHDVDSFYFIRVRTDDLVASAPIAPRDDEPTTRESIDDLLMRVLGERVAVDADVGVVVPRQGAAVAQRAPQRSVHEIVRNGELFQDVDDGVRVAHQRRYIGFGAFARHAGLVRVPRPRVGVESVVGRDDEEEEDDADDGYAGEKTASKSHGGEGRLSPGQNCPDRKHRRFLSSKLVSTALFLASLNRQSQRFRMHLALTACVALTMFRSPSNSITGNHVRSTRSPKYRTRNIS